MPKIALPIKGLKETFSRPVVAELVRELITWTGLPKNIMVQIPGDNEVVHQRGSSVDPQAGHNTYDETARLFITYDDDYEESLVTDMTVFRPDQPHFFFDETTRTFMRPAMSRNKIVITVRYQANDKGTADRWRNEIRTRSAHGRFDTYHNLTYSYLIPQEFMIILKEIHRLRENIAGYNETFDAYLDKHLTKKATTVTDLGGKNHELAIRDTQARINGYFDFDVAPNKPTRAKDGTSWNVEFDYTLIIDKPVAAVMYYELLIHNQPLPRKYVHTAPPKNMENNELSFSMSNRLNYIGENFSNPRAHIEPGFKYPLYDEWVPDIVFQHTLRLFTGLVAVDNTDKRSLMKLTDVRPYKFSTGVLRYMRRNYAKLNTRNATMINVSVYEFGEPLAPNMFTVDADLNVKLTADSDFRKIYHVRVSVLSNPLVLPESAIDDLCDDYDGTLEMMNFIAPGCSRAFPLKRLGPTYVHKGSLMELMRCRYKQAMKHVGAGDPTFWANVMTLCVVAHTKED